MKDVGEPCAGEPHARFDGRALETEQSRQPNTAALGKPRDLSPDLPTTATAPALDPTTPPGPTYLQPEVVRSSIDSPRIRGPAETGPEVSAKNRGWHSLCSATATAQNVEASAPDTWDAGFARMQTRLQPCRPRWWPWDLAHRSGMGAGAAQLVLGVESRLLRGWVAWLLRAAPARSEGRRLPACGPGRAGLRGQGRAGCKAPSQRPWDSTGSTTSRLGRPRGANAPVQPAVVQFARPGRAGEVCGGRPTRRTGSRPGTAALHLLCHQCDHLLSSAAVGEHLGDDVEAEHLVVGGSVVCAGLTAPDGDLADEDAHHRQQHGGLDVGAALDGEPLVGPGEKEVEPHAGGEAGDQGRHSPPGQDHHRDRLRPWPRPNRCSGPGCVGAP